MQNKKKNITRSICKTRKKPLETDALVGQKKIKKYRELAKATEPKDYKLVDKQNEYKAQTEKLKKP